MTTATRASSESAGMPNFFGMEALLPKTIVDPSKLMSVSSGNSNVGTGQIQRNEAVTLSLAGVVTQVLPNGNLVVAARQEFRVNDELRELQVTGVIRHAGHHVGEHRAEQSDRGGADRVWRARAAHRHPGSRAGASR